MSEYRQIQSSNTLELRKLQKKQQAKLTNILIALGVVLIILFLLVLVAMIFGNDLSEIVRVNNPQSQDSTGISPDGSSGTIVSPTNVPMEVSPTVTVKPVEEQIIENNFNVLVFYPDSVIYNIKIRQDTILTLINDTGAHLGLVFSDGRTVGLRVDESKSIIFAQPGTYTFREVGTNLDPAIEGTIVVVP